MSKEDPHGDDILSAMPFDCPPYNSSTAIASFIHASQMIRLIWFWYSILAMASDIRVAAESVRMGVPTSRMG